jgi:polar amino acid transport system permease protein
MNIPIDWSGVLSGPPLQWLISGLVMSLCVTVSASVVTGVLAVTLLGLRISANRAPRWFATAVISVIRNTPLLVQLLFWYFAAYNLLPLEWRFWITDPHPWAQLPAGVNLISPEFIASTWALGLFSAVFIAEEIRAGLQAVAKGQSEAALSQGFGHWAALRHVLLPQALANAFQPVVGQYLNLMKLSSLLSAIGLAEVTYQVRQIESYNSHAMEAFAAGTLVYLTLGLVMGQTLQRFDPARRRQRRAAAATFAEAGVRLAPALGNAGSGGRDGV